VVRFRVRLPKVHKSEFEKAKFKNFNKVVDLQIETTGGGGIRAVGG
jgi:hypothetical protein